LGWLCQSVATKDGTMQPSNDPWANLDLIIQQMAAMLDAAEKKAKTCETEKKTEELPPDVPVFERWPSP
jgi:hypothetical protein